MAMTKIAASEVFPILEKWILADGFDIVMDYKKSKGARIYDSKNERSFLDLFSFFASNPVGFNHPMMSDPDFERELLEGAKIKASNSDIYTTYLASFVDYFHQNFTAQFDKLFFIEGGALAVENCMKAAQDWKTRKNIKAGKSVEGGEIIHFRWAFHGRTGYTLSVTNTDPKKTKYFPKFDWPRVTTPKLKFPITDEEITRVKEKEDKAVQEIEQAFLERKDRIAAILIEPIQGEGGDNFFRKEFLQKLKDLCLEHEALLIFDEVQTGLGITGKAWAHEHYGVKPDLMAFGKKVQVCGVAADMKRLDEVDNVFRVSSRINSTWGGNLVDMIRSRQFMKIIKEQDLMKNAEVLGKKILSDLLSISKEDDRVSNVRGLGFWIAFDLPTTPLRDEFQKICFENGLMILPCGWNSMRLRPVLDLSPEEANEGLDLIKKGLQDLPRN